MREKVKRGKETGGWSFFFLSSSSNKKPNRRLVQVQAEEISDEEWQQMMTDDLRRHGVLGQIVDTVPPYIVNVDYADDACVHMGNSLVPSQTQLQPHQVK